MDDVSVARRSFVFPAAVLFGSRFRVVGCGSVLGLVSLSSRALVAGLTHSLCRCFWLIVTIFCWFRLDIVGLLSVLVLIGVLLLVLVLLLGRYGRYLVSYK